MGERAVHDPGTGLGAVATPNPLQDRTFVSTSVTEHGVPRPLVPGTQIRLGFTVEGISANAGCNALNFAVQVEPNQLVVGEVVSTLIGCAPEREEQDRWLTEFIAAGPGWIATAAGLTLTSGAVQIELAEEVGKPRPLWGRSFVSTSVTEFDLPWPLVPGTAITLTFTEPELLTAEAGCNVLNFVAQTGGEGLLIGGGVASTDLACSAELHAQDTWLTEFLVSPPSAVLLGNTLTLSLHGTDIVLIEVPLQPTPTNAAAVDGVDGESGIVAPDGLLQDRRFGSVAVIEHGKPRPLVPGTHIELIFFIDGITAQAGCNTLSFPAQIEPDRLVVGDVSSTLIGCEPEREEQDRWLAEFLAAGPSWTESAGRLTLTAGETTIVLTEMGLQQGVEPTELWGLSFVSIAVSETGIVPAPVVEGTEITLTFTAPDRLTAHAGCNTMNFQVEVGDTHLSVADDVATTRIACSDELQAQDEWLTAFLVDDPEYAFTGGSLTLTRASTDILLVTQRR